MKISILATAFASFVLRPALADNTFDKPQNTSNNRPTVVSIKVKDQSDIQHLADKFDILDVDKKSMTVSALVNSHEKTALENEQYIVGVDDAATAELEQASADGIAGYTCYRTVEETYATGASLAANYPDIAEWIDIGDTWEKTQDAANGYDIYALKITNKNNVVVGGKPVFFANCAIHAREYTTAELCTRFAETLVEGYGKDAGE